MLHIVIAIKNITVQIFLSMNHFYLSDPSGTQSNIVFDTLKFFAKSPFPKVNPSPWPPDPFPVPFREITVLPVFASAITLSKIITCPLYSCASLGFARFHCPFPLPLAGA